LENIKWGEGHISSLPFVNETYPSVSSANFGTWESPARLTDGRTNRRPLTGCVAVSSLWGRFTTQRCTGLLQSLFSDAVLTVYVLYRRLGWEELCQRGTIIAENENSGEPQVMKPYEKSKGRGSAEYCPTT
jgi:hypothetical protein